MTRKDITPGLEQHIGRARTLLGLVQNRIDGSNGLLTQFQMEKVYADGVKIFARVLHNERLIKIRYVEEGVKEEKLVLYRFIPREGYPQAIVHSDGTLYFDKRIQAGHNYSQTSKASPISFSGAKVYEKGYTLFDAEMSVLGVLKVNNYYVFIVTDTGYVAQTDEKVYFYSHAALDISYEISDFTTPLIQLSECELVEEIETGKYLPEGWEKLEYESVTSSLNGEKALLPMTMKTYSNVVSVMERQVIFTLGMSSIPSSINISYEIVDSSKQGSITSKAAKITVGKIRKIEEDPCGTGENNVVRSFHTGPLTTYNPDGCWPVVDPESCQERVYPDGQHGYSVDDSSSYSNGSVSQGVSPVLFATMLDDEEIVFGASNYLSSESSNGDHKNGIILPEYQEFAFVQSPYGDGASSEGAAQEAARVMNSNGTAHNEFAYNKRANYSYSGNTFSSVLLPWVTTISEIALNTSVKITDWFEYGHTTFYNYFSVSSDSSCPGGGGLFEMSSSVSGGGLRNINLSGNNARTERTSSFAALSMRFNIALVFNYSSGTSNTYGFYPEDDYTSPPAWFLFGDNYDLKYTGSRFYTFHIKDAQVVIPGIDARIGNAPILKNYNAHVGMMNPGSGESSTGETSYLPNHPSYGSFFVDFCEHPKKYVLLSIADNEIHAVPGLPNPKETEHNVVLYLFNIESKKFIDLVAPYNDLLIKHEEELLESGYEIAPLTNEVSEVTDDHTTLLDGGYGIISDIPPGALL